MHTFTRAQLAYNEVDVTLWSLQRRWLGFKCILYTFPSKIMLLIHETRAPPLISLCEFNLVHLESSRRRQNIIQQHTTRGHSRMRIKNSFRKLGWQIIPPPLCATPRCFASAGLIFCSFSFFLVPRDTIRCDSIVSAWCYS
jgi:hypothetical protein